MEFSNRAEKAIMTAKAAKAAKDEAKAGFLRLQEEMQSARSILLASEARMESGDASAMPEWIAARRRVASIESLLDSNWNVQHRVDADNNVALSELWTSILADHVNDD